MNPILPKQYFVPDAEPRVWNDGRIYIYGSYDIPGNINMWCSHTYHVFSSEDLVNWKDHGESFRSKKQGSDELYDVPWDNSLLFAPDCIYKDGLYYLYFCMMGNDEGVAISTTPYGPFKNAMPIKGAHKDAIDPAIFIDDDGEAYYYWGQFECRGARLKEDMKTIDEETINRSLINEKEHGFHEGSSMRKRNGLYYLIYTDISRGKASCLSYAISKSPLGPFTKGGVIIDNDGGDPETWNNHGSIAEFSGQWYIFYHCSSQGNKFNRRAYIEKIYFNDDGSIDEVEMTTQGVSEPLEATNLIEAYRACQLSGNVHTEQYYLGSEECREYLAYNINNDWAAYKFIDFKEGVSKFEVKVATLTNGGTIEVRIDAPNGPIISTCRVNYTGGWHQWKVASSSVTKVTGIHAIYLLFKGDVNAGRLFNVDSFIFK